MKFRMRDNMGGMGRYDQKILCNFPRRLSQKLGSELVNKEKQEKCKIYIIHGGKSHNSCEEKLFPILGLKELSCTYLHMGDAPAMLD